MKRRTLSAIAVIAVIALGLPLANAGALVLKDFPIGGLLESNECTGEDLNLAGTAHIVVNDNGVHLKIADATAEGVDTGTDWTSKSSSVQHLVTTESDNGASTSTFVFRIRMTNGDDSFSVSQTAHITVNANGDVTADFEIDDATCK